MAAPNATALFAAHQAAVQAAEAAKDAEYERAKQIRVKADEAHESTLSDLEAGLEAELDKRRAACAEACRAALRPVCEAFADDDTRSNAEAVLTMFREHDQATLDATGENLSPYHLGLAFVELAIEQDPRAVLAFGDLGGNVYQELMWPAQAALKAATRPEQYDTILAVEAAAQQFARKRGAQGLDGSKRRYEAWRSTTSAGRAEAAIKQIHADEEEALKPKVGLEQAAQNAARQHKQGLLERMYSKLTGASAP